MNFPLGQTVTRLRWDYSTDGYGDQVRSGTVARLDIEQCAVAPRSSNDLLEPARQGVLVGLAVYIADVATDIDPVTDQIEFESVVYDIEGTIGRWRSPFSNLSGIELSLKRAVG